MREILSKIIVVINLSNSVNACSRVEDPDNAGAYIRNDDFDINDFADIDDMPDWMKLGENLATVRPTKASAVIDDQAAADIYRDFQCLPMLTTAWKVKKSQLYKRGNLPTSNYYYIGKWQKEDQNGDTVVSRNPKKNCWRRFIPSPVTYDAGYDYSLCAGTDWDCAVSVIKNSSSSSSAFKYQLHDSLFENYGIDAADFAGAGLAGALWSVIIPLYNAFDASKDKFFVYEDKANCKVQIMQNEYGIETTLELRGKEKSTKPGRPGRPEIFDAKPRSIYFKCFYPTVDIDFDPTTQRPRALEGTQYQKIWESTYPGYEKIGTDLIVTRWGRLSAEFTMDVVGGTADGKDPTKIGDTVLVQIKPNLEKSPELREDADLAPDLTDDDDKVGNEKHYRWTLNKCFIRNLDLRPTYDLPLENKINFGEITRQPEDHPFYEYIEVEIVKRNCFHNNYYARAFTKYARDKENQGLFVGYESFHLANLGKDSITLDCDIKFCFRNPLVADTTSVPGKAKSDFLYDDCYVKCEDEPGPNNEPFDPPAEAWHTTTDFSPWVTTTQRTAQVDDIMTEEPRTFNFAFAVNQKKQGGGTEVVYHTNPYFRVDNPSGSVDYAKIGITEFPPLNVNNANNYQYRPENPDDGDIEVDKLGDRRDPEGVVWNNGVNDPKWYATVEPETYKTVTPWKNWREGMLQHRNCTEWRDAGKPWGDFDEKRCDLITEFMSNGPQGDQDGDNAKAIEDIKSKNFADDPTVCDEAMVKMEVTGCSAEGICIANCQNLP